MDRSLWKYRPLLCKLGLHDLSERQASTLVPIEGGYLRPGYRVMAECDRRGCTYSAEVSPPVAVSLDQVRIVADRFEPGV